MTGASVLLACALFAQADWSFTAGSERIAFRDIARNGPPADAAPVAWEGSGPSLRLTRTHEGVRRFHRVVVDFATASSFVYDGPVHAARAAASDRARRLEGRYEYRRYFLNDLVVQGLDVGVGVQGFGRRLTRGRDTTGGRLSSADSAAAVAGTVAARWHRSPRWSAEVAWINGSAVIRNHEQWSGIDAYELSRTGGAWLTDLAVDGRVRIRRGWALTMSYLQTGEGTAVSHTSYSLGRRRVAAGVTYAR